jgi:two-component system chemotaxis response regulator CheB
MNPIKVLIVDDSNLVRTVLAEILKAVDDIEVVGTANDPYEARDMIKALDPDVLTLDIEMPKMDGITFLKNLMRLKPMPVVMLSTLTAQGADATLMAMELGAVDFIQKPGQTGANMLKGEFVEELTSKIRAAFHARNHILKKGQAATMEAVPSPKHAPISLPPTSRGRVIAIGSSTGGTEALFELLTALPMGMPPIVIAQHIPPAFSARFAERLNKRCAITVSEAVHGEPLKESHAYIAPGGRHLKVKRQSGVLKCYIEDSEPVNRHKPSVEALFDSLIPLELNSLISVMLTGMGSDGAEAMLRLKNHGAVTIAQDEESSLIWGMPGSAVKLGAVKTILPLSRMADALIKQLTVRER